jgi:predicted aldo/keto reductase-like oxidoreductase
MGKALKDGYRQKVRVATKSPLWQIKKANDFDMYLKRTVEKIWREDVSPCLYIPQEQVKEILLDVLTNHP